MKFISREAVRFLLAGMLNTAIGYLIYLFALQFMPYRRAYSVAYVLSILISYSLNTLFVFKEPWSWQKLASFPLVYVVQYVAGLVVLSALVVYLNVWEEIAPLLVVGVTLPLTFFASRYIIKWKKT